MVVGALLDAAARRVANIAHEAASAGRIGSGVRLRGRAPVAAVAPLPVARGDEQEGGQDDVAERELLVVEHGCVPHFPGPKTLE